jgi:anthranilate synthase/aminodeoxychorismate synthase-like glutamine amidotransferase
MHGRASVIRHVGVGIFEGLANPLTVGRYHSLVVDPNSLPEELEVTARTEDGVVMALAHRDWPVFGVQFHPESILTEGGHALLANFLKLSGIGTPTVIPTLAGERPVVTATESAVPTGPVTF